MAAPRKSKVQTSYEQIGLLIDALSTSLSEQLGDIIGAYEELGDAFKAQVQAAVPQAVRQPAPAPVPRRAVAQAQDNGYGEEAPAPPRGRGRPVGSTNRPPAPAAPVRQTRRPAPAVVEEEEDDFAALEAGFAEPDESTEAEGDEGDWGTGWAEDQPAPVTTRRTR